MGRETLIISAVLVFNLLWALYTTLSKEKIMIKQGEGALPSSTYLFILIRHITRLVGFIVAFESLGVSTIASAGYRLFMLVFLITVVIEVFSAVVETIIRTVMFKIMFAKKEEK